MQFDVHLIRAVFPALHVPVEESTLPIFFDNPAGSQVPQPVIDATVDYYLHKNANQGGLFATSRLTSDVIQSARERMADFLNAPSPDEIVFGPNMTTLNFALSRAIAQTLAPGDEIVVTRMDHDANIMPWLRVAEDRGLTVRWVDIHTEDCTLDMGSYERALSSRTKVVAVVHASNAVGTINPIAPIVERAHAVGALCVVDAVQSAPHVTIDVQALGCDFLLCSAYKFFGPHIGILWGRYELLANLPAYKVRPVKNVPPARWETGTPSFETIHGVSAALDYLASVGEQFGQGDFPGYAGRRLVFKRAMTAIQQYEQTLASHLIAGLQTLPGVTVAGITDSARGDARVPTVAFVMEGCTPCEIAASLGDQHIYVWHGNYYAQEIMERLGHGEHGMVRVGPVHYNTVEEIDRLIAILGTLPTR